MLDRLLGGTWTYIVLFFGSIIALVFASGHAAGTSYIVGNWLHYGWFIGFAFMTGAAFVSLYAWNAVRLFEVGLMSLVFAGVLDYAHAWPYHRTSLLWLGLSVLSVLWSWRVKNYPHYGNGSPSDRLFEPWLSSIVFGVFACIEFWSWATLVVSIVCPIAIIVMALIVPNRRQPAPPHRGRSQTA